VFFKKRGLRFASELAVVSMLPNSYLLR